MDPFHTHLFLCTNERPGDKESCSKRGAQQLRDELKRTCKQKFPEASLRINNSGCLGFCERGIAAVLYPEGKWFFDLKPSDAPTLLAEIESDLAKDRRLK